VADHQTATGNAAQIEFWNSAATRTWADQYARMDRAVGALTKELLDLAAPQPGECVLDIGCGAGTTVLELARRVGPSGHVLGADVSEPSVARARERIAAAGLPQAEAMVADVSVHPFAPNSFELAFSRFGIMFFSDPVAAFANVRRAMKPGGRLALAVFRAASEKLWPNAPLEAVRHLLPPIPTPGPEEAGPFSWAVPARVHRIVEGAAFGARPRDLAHNPCQRRRSYPVRQVKAIPV
jgi:SAM-dependent methyltransferase